MLGEAGFIVLGNGNNYSFPTDVYRYLFSGVSKETRTRALTRAEIDLCKLQSNSVFSQAACASKTPFIFYSFNENINNNVLTIEDRNFIRNFPESDSIALYHKINYPSPSGTFGLSNKTFVKISGLGNNYYFIISGGPYIVDPYSNIWDTNVALVSTAPPPILTPPLLPPAPTIISWDLSGTKSQTPTQKELTGEKIVEIFKKVFPTGEMEKKKFEREFLGILRKDSVFSCANGYKISTNIQGNSSATEITGITSFYGGGCTLSNFIRFNSLNIPLSQWIQPSPNWYRLAPVSMIGNTRAVGYITSGFDFNQKLNGDQNISFSINWTEAKKAGAAPNLAFHVFFSYENHPDFSGLVNKTLYDAYTPALQFYVNLPSHDFFESEIRTYDVYQSYQSICCDPNPTFDKSNWCDQKLIPGYTGNFAIASGKKIKLSVLQHWWPSYPDPDSQQTTCGPVFVRLNTGVTFNYKWTKKSQVIGISDSILKEVSLGLNQYPPVGADYIIEKFNFTTDKGLYQLDVSGNNQNWRQTRTFFLGGRKVSIDPFPLPDINYIDYKFSSSYTIPIILIAEDGVKSNEPRGFDLLNYFNLNIVSSNPNIAEGIPNTLNFGGTGSFNIKAPGSVAFTILGKSRNENYEDLAPVTKILNIKSINKFPQQIKLHPTIIADRYDFSEQKYVHKLFTNNLNSYYYNLTYNDGGIKNISSNPQTQFARWVIPPTGNFIYTSDNNNVLSGIGDSILIKNYGICNITASHLGDEYFDGKTETFRIEVSPEDRQDTPLQWKIEENFILPSIDYLKTKEINIEGLYKYSNLKLAEINSYRDEWKINYYISCGATSFDGPAFNLSCERPDMYYLYKTNELEKYKYGDRNSISNIYIGGGTRNYNSLYIHDITGKVKIKSTFYGDLNYKPAFISKDYTLLRSTGRYFIWEKLYYDNASENNNYFTGIYLAESNISQDCIFYNHVLLGNSPQGAESWIKGKAEPFYSIINENPIGMIFATNPYNFNGKISYKDFKIIKPGFAIVEAFYPSYEDFNIYPQLRSEQQGAELYSGQDPIVKRISVLKQNQEIRFNPSKTYYSSNKLPFKKNEVFQPFISINTTQTKNSYKRAPSQPVYYSNNLNCIETSNEFGSAGAARTHLVIRKPGTVTITGVLESNDWFNEHIFTKTYQIDKINPVLNFPDIPRQTTRILNRVLDLNISSPSEEGAIINLSSSDIRVASFENNSLGITSAGETVITASISGNDYYNPVTISKTLYVDKILNPVAVSDFPIISYIPNNTLDFKYLINDVNLFSGLTSSDNNIATIDAINNVVIKSPGKVNINFHFFEDTVYLPTIVTKQLTIKGPPFLNNPIINTKVGENINYFLDINNRDGDNFETPTISNISMPNYFGLNSRSITGYSTGNGTFNGIVNLTNNYGTSGQNIIFQIAPTITGIKNISTKVDNLLSFEIQKTGVVNFYSGSNLPPGLSVVNGYITGTPTQRGIYSSDITIGYNDGVNFNTSKEIFNFEIRKNLPIVIMPEPSVTGYVGYNFDYKIKYDMNENRSPETFSVSNLPNGLLLNGTDGLIYGRPRNLGTSSIVIKAYNNGGESNAGNLNLVFLANVGDVPCLR